MDIYSEYLGKKLDWESLSKERKKQLARISQIRNRPILVYASALTKNNAPITINYDDRVPFLGQLSEISGEKIDLILETSGGLAEIVEDIIRAIRSKFAEFSVIVPGWAKSAGTIMVMAADEILMEPSSALGPIDAQMVQNGKQYAAHAFLEGLRKIKDETAKDNNLNRAYIPILQNISLGEIQGCENALAFSQKLVTNWLSSYKFKFWDKHSTTGLPVTEEDKKKRAKEIAAKLCDHGYWLTHGRSISMQDLTGPELRLQINDYSEEPDLYDAIRRYYTLLKMTFDTTNIYKVFETPTSQIYMYTTPQINQGKPPSTIDFAVIDFKCPMCHTEVRLQANFKKGIPLEPGVIQFPTNNMLECPSCKTSNNLKNLRIDIEFQTKKRIIP